MGHQDQDILLQGVGGVSWRPLRPLQTALRRSDVRLPHIRSQHLLSQQPSWLACPAEPAAMGRARVVLLPAATDTLTLVSFQVGHCAWVPSQPVKKWQVSPPCSPGSVPSSTKLCFQSRPTSPSLGFHSRAQTGHQRITYVFQFADEGGDEARPLGGMCRDPRGCGGPLAGLPLSALLVSLTTPRP